VQRTPSAAPSPLPSTTATNSPNLRHRNPPAPPRPSRNRTRCPQVRNLNASDNGYTVLEIKAMGLTVENTVLVPQTRVAAQLPWPSESEGGQPVKPTGQRPPLLRSVRNVTGLWVRGGSLVAVGGVISQGS